MGKRKKFSCFLLSSVNVFLPLHTWHKSSIEYVKENWILAVKACWMVILTWGLQSEARYWLHVTNCILCILTASQDPETLRQSGWLLGNGWNNSKPTESCDRTSYKRNTCGMLEPGERELSFLWNSFIHLHTTSIHSSIHLHFAVWSIHDLLLIKYRTLIVSMAKIQKT
jgi:hypothetical protein